MPQRSVEQTQRHCGACGCLTRHERMRTEINHILHLLITLFCCGVWLPVWLCLIVFGGRAGSWRCVFCGSVGGTSAPPAVASTSDWPAAPPPLPGEVLERIPLHRAKPSRLAAAVETWGLWVWRGLRSLPGRADRGLARISGEGNDLIYRFLEIMAVSILITGLLFLVWWLVF